MITRSVWVVTWIGACVGACAAPGLAAADGLVIPGIGPESEYGRPSYREATFPPPQHNALGIRTRTPLPSDRPSYREEYDNFPPAGGRYGGGFIEYILTGGRPELVASPAAPVYAAPAYAAPIAAPVYAAPPAYEAPAYAAPTYAPAAEAAPLGGLFDLPAAFAAPAESGYVATTVSPLRGSLPKGGLPDYAPQARADGSSASTASAARAVPASDMMASYNAPGDAQAVDSPMPQPLYGEPPVAGATAYPPLAGAAGPTSRSMNPLYERQMVAYSGRERAGTIIIDTPDKFLYLVEGNGRAIRYGIGVGRPGFSWSGVKSITRKAEWPGWTPPSQMLKRRPDLPRHMVGGEGNPLGARAMYLGSSLYRIHGTNEPDTIGTNVSSGCIRMMNPDVIDLYGRVGVGTRVVVM